MDVCSLVVYVGAIKFVYTRDASALSGFEGQSFSRSLCVFLLLLRLLLHPLARHAALPLCNMHLRPASPPVHREVSASSFSLSLWLALHPFKTSGHFPSVECTRSYRYTCMHIHLYSSACMSLRDLGACLYVCLMWWVWTSFSLGVIGPAERAGQGKLRGVFFSLCL